MTTDELRAECRTLLETILDDGLEELRERMLEIKAFYDERASYQPIAIPEPQIVSGKIEGTYIRPPFVIDDD